MRSRRIATTLAAIGAAFPAAALAASAEGETEGREAANAEIKVLQRPAAALHRTIDVQVRRLRTERQRLLRERRDRLYANLPGGISPATLESIAACESGGDPAAVSADGTYRGKYQFDYGTWASVGGSGDPAAAPEAEQDYRAALLYSQAGSSPWPNCA